MTPLEIGILAFFALSIGASIGYVLGGVLHYREAAAMVADLEFIEKQWSLIDEERAELRAQGIFYSWLVVQISEHAISCCIEHSLATKASNFLCRGSSLKKASIKGKACFTSHHLVVADGGYVCIAMAPARFSSVR